MLSIKTLERDIVLVLPVAKASIPSMPAGSEGDKLGHQAAFTMLAMLSTRALALKITPKDWRLRVHHPTGDYAFLVANGAPQWTSRRIDTACQKSDDDQTLKMHDWI